MAFFTSPDVGQAFRENRQLQQFVLTDVTPTGRKLGTGSFGSVEEVTYQQITCAGKRIHEALLDVENEGVPEMIQKYQQECQLMSSLRHPNVTLFLGLCFLPGTQLPLLVMELLETSLDDLLEHMPNLPLSLKRSILANVASGLLYLHERNPPVIHRDLTSRNVILTSSLVAKITDMGNSCIIRPGQVVRTLSKLPGTLVYMPPEARDYRHRYGPSLDIFSFGHLALFTITQKFPGDLLPSTYINPDNPEEIRGRSELECRGRYIGLLEAQIISNHPALVALIKECLNNAPDRRPTTNNLLARLQRMREEVEGEYGGPVKLDMVRVRLAKEVKRKDRRIEELTQQQRSYEAEKVRELRAKDQEIAQQRGIIQQLQTEMQRQNEQMAGKDRENASRVRENAEERDRVQQLQYELQVNNEDMAAKDRGIAQQRGRVRQLQEELHLRETRLREELQSQEAEISRLREELSKCQGLLQEGAKASLKLPLQLKWRCGPDMPFVMSHYIQSVQVQGTLYVGGGYHADSDDNNDHNYIIMVYDISAGKWATLPPYSTRNFAMTAINDHLVLVGGRRCDGVSSKALGMWSEDCKKWTHMHPYPDMTTPRCLCSAVVYKQYLAVAGGVRASGVKLSSVEVMNTDTKQWYAGPPTPIAWSSMKTAIVGDTCYFVGGWIDPYCPTNYAYSISLPALVSQLNSDSSAKDTQTWKELPQLPATDAAPLSISGSLLAVGGWDKDGKELSALHLYQPDAGQWVKVADMPAPRYDSTCIMISDKELLVAGGWRNTHRTPTTDLAQIY